MALEVARVGIVLCQRPGALLREIKGRSVVTVHSSRAFARILPNCAQLSRHHYPIFEINDRNQEDASVHPERVAGLALRTERLADAADLGFALAQRLNAGVDRIIAQH